mmetsp:Transcript_11186/g.24215  ORF Transcript_11186/g.24215 Transcript_11186/m.24215 type:complete len:389 (+) Transcript_11186:237-1403(+)
MRPRLRRGHEPLGVLARRPVRPARIVQLPVRTTDHPLLDGDHLQPPRYLLVPLDPLEELVPRAVVVGEAHSQPFLLVDEAVSRQPVPRGPERVPHARPDVGLAEEPSLRILAEVDADEPPPGCELRRPRPEDGPPVRRRPFPLGRRGLVPPRGVHVLAPSHGRGEAAEPVHGREAHAEVDRAGGVALVVKADAARLDVHVGERVGVGDRPAVRVGHGLDPQGVVEDRPPLVGQLVLVVDHDLLLLAIRLLLLVVPVSHGLDHLAHEPQRRPGVGGAVVGDVVRRASHAERTEGLFPDLVQHQRRGRVDDVEASLGACGVLSLAVLADGDVRPRPARGRRRRARLGGGVGGRRDHAAGCREGGEHYQGREFHDVAIIDECPVVDSQCGM